MATFAEAMIRFTADGGPLTKQLAGIQRAVGDAGDRMASTFRHAMLGIGAAVAAAIGPAAVILMTKATADAGDELNKLSQRVGIGVETLSGYKVAAELADVSMQDLAKSLQIASRNIVDASTGTGDAAKAFDRLGISVTDQGGKLKSAEQIMLEVADKFAQMEDGSLKTALAMDIFGRSGAQMIPLLNQGSAAILAQRKEAELLGATWTTAQAQQAEAFNDNLTRIQAGLAGFRNQIVSGLLPFFNEALTAIIEKMKEWSASGDLQAWAVSVSTAIVEGFVWAAQTTADLARTIGVVVDAFRVLMTIIHIVEGVFEAFVSTFLHGLNAILDPLATAAETLGLPFAEGLRNVQRMTQDWAETLAQAGQQAGESAAEWWESVGTSSAGAERIAAGIDQVAIKFREWADKAKAGATETVTAIGEATTQVGNQVVRSITDQVKTLDSAFKTAKTRGDVSMQQELEHLQKRAAMLPAGSAERAKAESEAAKFKQQMEDRLFEHEKAMGKKSLDDEVSRLRERVAATAEGSEARMKAEEELFKKEEELRRQQTAAAGIAAAKTAGALAAPGGQPTTIGALGERLAGAVEGVALTPEQRGAKFDGDWGQTLTDLVSMGREDLMERLLQRFGPTGNLEDVFRLQVAAQGLPEVSPLSDLLPGMEGGVGTTMEGAYTALDDGLTRMEARVQESGDRIKVTIFQNLEQWFVDKLMREAARA